MTDFTPDPFAAPTPTPVATPPAPAGYAPPAYAAAPEPVGAPIDMRAHAYAPVPPVWGSGTQTVGPRALAAVIGVIAFLASVAILNLFNVVAEDRVNADPAWGLMAVPVLLLWAAAGVYSYVSLSLWMVRVRALRLERRMAAPPTWRIWAGWFIPILTLFVPYQTVKDLKEGLRDTPSTGMLVLWWLPWLLFLVLDRAVYSQGASGGALAGMAAVIVGALAVSTFALVRIVRGITAAMDAMLATAPAAPVWPLA